MTNQPTDAELHALLANDDVPDEQLAPYFTFEEDKLPAGMGPSAAVSPDVVNLSTATEGILGAFNARAGRKRLKKFKERAKGFTGITIVSQGDSWFQYPTRKDTIDHLFDNEQLNIYSLDNAGDWLANMVINKPYLPAIECFEPSVFLISGGGNDLVGKSRMMWLLRRYEPGRPARWYTEGALERVLGQLRELYEELFDELTSRFPNMRIIGHGYDHAIPNGQRWLGKPMTKIAIEDANLQRNIVSEMIDRFNEMRIELARKYDGKVAHVDCRGLVDDWYDELHPNSDGYARVAEQFAREIL